MFGFQVPTALLQGSAASADWEAVGHTVQDGWVNFGTRWGPWIFAALMGFVVVRGLLRASRYHAAEALHDADRQALRDRVAAAEARTDGEIVVVVVEASDDHPDAAWKAAAVTLAVGTLLLGGVLPTVGALGLVGLQAAIGAGGYALARMLADFRRSFVREARASEVAEEQALQELQRLDLTSKSGRSAVLLFVSVFEQRVVVLADEAAHAAAGENGWVAADAAVLGVLQSSGGSGGHLREALERGIDSVGETLAKALPATGERENRFDDDVEVRRR
ncbi:hypothetical protein [Saltatorellus ferox]